jgi:threonine/homoserine/homoserine lactone efflux protein
MLLLAKLMLDTQRDYMLAAPEAHMSEWRLVFAVWAYMIIVMSMWMVISPWRMRDMMEWMQAKPRRLAAMGWFRLGFGVLLIVLGLTVFTLPAAN